MIYGNLHGEDGNTIVLQKCFQSSNGSFNGKRDDNIY